MTERCTCQKIVFVQLRQQLLQRVRISASPSTPSLR
jgi:hypothetical protein